MFQISRTRPGVRAGPGLMRTTLCSVTTAGCILTSETPLPTLTVLGRNQHNFWDSVKNLKNYNLTLMLGPLSHLNMENFSQIFVTTEEAPISPLAYHLNLDEVFVIPHLVAPPAVCAAKPKNVR